MSLKVHDGVQVAQISNQKTIEGRGFQSGLDPEQPLGEGFSVNSRGHEEPLLWRLPYCSVVVNRNL